MARMVCCYDIGREKRPIEECWKAPNNHYYTSEEAYNTIQRNKEWRKKCYILYKNWIGDENENTIPTFWCYKMKNIKEDYEVIYEAMQLAEKDVLYSIEHKEFDSDRGACNYIWAIVQDRIFRAKKNIRAVQKAKIEAENKLNQYNDEPIEISDEAYKQKTIDVRRWL